MFYFAIPAVVYNLRLQKDTIIILRKHKHIPSVSD